MVAEISELVYEGEFAAVVRDDLRERGLRSAAGKQGLERAPRHLGNSTVDDSVLIVNQHIPAVDNLPPTVVGVAARCHILWSVAGWTQMLRVT